MFRGAAEDLIECWFTAAALPRSSSEHDDTEMINEPVNKTVVNFALRLIWPPTL